MVNLDWGIYRLGDISLTLRPEKRKSIIFFLAASFKGKTTKDYSYARKVVKNGSGRTVKQRVIKALLNASDIPSELREAKRLSFNDPSILKKLNDEYWLEYFYDLIGVKKGKSEVFSDFFLKNHKVEFHYSTIDMVYQITTFDIQENEYESIKAVLKQFAELRTAKLNVALKNRYHIPTLIYSFSLNSQKNNIELAIKLFKELETMFVDFKLDHKEIPDYITNEKVIWDDKEKKIKVTETAISDNEDKKYVTNLIKEYGIRDTLNILGVDARVYKHNEVIKVDICDFGASLKETNTSIISRMKHLKTLTSIIANKQPSSITLNLSELTKTTETLLKECSGVFDRINVKGVNYTNYIINTSGSDVVLTESKRLRAIINDEVTDIYINPKKLPPVPSTKMISSWRVGITKDNMIYIWDSWKAIHAQIEDEYDILFSSKYVVRHQDENLVTTFINDNDTHLLKAIWPQLKFTYKEGKFNKEKDDTASRIPILS